MSLETDIMEILQVRARGKNMALPRSLLRMSLMRPDLTDRQLRKIIKKMIEKDGQPIGTTSHGGYYWITSVKEWELNYQEIMSRIRSLGKRASVYRKNWRRAEMEGQRGLNETLLRP